MILSAREIADCQTDLLTYIKIVFKYHYKREFIENWHHKAICTELEKVVILDTKRLIINLPPRYSKTELGVVCFIAWSIGIFSKSEFIHASYSKRLATKNSYSAKALVESEIHKQIFPNTALRYDAKAKDEWKTAQGGVVYATGSEGTITGYGAGAMCKEFSGAIIIDDPHKASEIHSKIKRQKVLDWFLNTMQSRANSADTAIILIMQRLHTDDLSGFLKNSGNNERWKSLVIPVLDKNKKPLWLLKHDNEKLEQIEKSNSHIFSSQYMQEPSAISGQLFKRNNWQYYDVLPNIEYAIITADTAQKTAEYNDFSVFEFWGYFQGNIYLIDLLRQRLEAPELLLSFFAFWNKQINHSTQENFKIRAAYFEDKSSGTGLIQQIKSDKKSSISVVAVPRNTDKLTRAMDCLPFIASGYVYLPQNAVFLIDYLDEFSNFSPTLSHKHDDQVDATLDAINILLGQSKKSSGTW